MKKIMVFITVAILLVVGVIRANAEENDFENFLDQADVEALVQMDGSMVAYITLNDVRDTRLCVSANEDAYGAEVTITIYRGNWDNIITQSIGVYTPWLSISFGTVLYYIYMGWL